MMLSERFPIVIISQVRHSSVMPSYDEDVDVAAERKRIMRGSNRNDILRLENLTKVGNTKISDTKYQV